MGKEAELLLSKLCSLYHAGQTAVVPDVFHFNSAIGAWAKSKDPSAPQRAQLLFNHMKELHATKSLPTAPNVVTCGSILYCWSRSQAKDAPEQAERILRGMLEGCLDDPSAESLM